MLKHLGFTLTELLVSLAISSMSILVSSSLLAEVSSKFVTIERKGRLQSEAFLVLSIIADDLQNANYDGLASLRVEDPALPPSPFKQSIKINALTAEPDSSCITFKHDKNKDGELTTHSPNERRGYRLNNKAIEFRMGDRSCDDTGWQDLTSTDFINIDSLVFNLRILESVISNVAVISISIDVSLSEAPQIKESYSMDIPIRNHSV